MKSLYDGYGMLSGKRHSKKKGEGMKHGMNHRECVDRDETPRTEERERERETR